MHIQVERRTESLNLCYRASAGCLFRITCLLDQMHGDDAIDYPEHLARDHRTAGEEKTQLGFLLTLTGCETCGMEAQICKFQCDGQLCELKCAAEEKICEAQAMVEDKLN